MATALRRFDGLLRNDPFYRTFFEGFDFPQVPAVFTDEPRAGLLLPRMNVEEGESAFKVSLEIPGMNKDDIHVEVEKGRLVVRGEKKEERSETHEKSNIHVREIRYGNFRRELVLPDNVDATNIGGSYKDGVLTLTVPKAEKRNGTTRVALS